MQIPHARSSGSKSTRLTCSNFLTRNCAALEVLMAVMANPAGSGVSNSVSFDI